MTASNLWASTCSPRAPIAEARHRHAELHGGDEPRRVAGDLEHLPGAAVALVLKLEDPRSARGDEAVLGPDEERVRNDQADEGQHLRGRTS